MSSEVIPRDKVRYRNVAIAFRHPQGSAASENLVFFGWGACYGGEQHTALPHNKSWRLHYFLGCGCGAGVE